MTPFVGMTSSLAVGRWASGGIGDPSGRKTHVGLGLRHSVLRLHLPRPILLSYHSIWKAFVPSEIALIIVLSQDILAIWWIRTATAIAEDAVLMLEALHLRLGIKA